MPLDTRGKHLCYVLYVQRFVDEFAILSNRNKTEAKVLLQFDMGKISFWEGLYIHATSSTERHHNPKLLSVFSVFDDVFRPMPPFPPNALQVTACS